MNSVLMLDASHRIDEVSCTVYEQICEHPAILSEPDLRKTADQAFAILAKLSRELSIIRAGVEGRPQLDRQPG